MKTPTGLKMQQTIESIVKKLEAGKGKSLKDNIEVIVSEIYKDIQTNGFVTVDGNPENIH